MKNRLPAVARVTAAVVLALSALQPKGDGDD